MTTPTPPEPAWQPPGHPQGPPPGQQAGPAPQPGPSQQPWQPPAWSPEQVGRPAPQSPRPLGGSFQVLAAVTQVALGAIIVLNGYVIMLCVRGLQWVDALESGTGNAGDGDELDARILIAALIYAAVSLACAGCFIAWSYTLRRSDRVAPEAMRFGPGWTIGGWFVPILNFVRPFQTTVNLWRGLARPATPHQAPTQPPVPGLVRVWWAAFLVMAIGGRLLIASVQNLQPTLDSARRAFWTEIAADSLNITAAVLAILVVRLITGRALRTQPIPIFGPWHGAAAPASFHPGYPVAPALGPDAGYPPIPGAQPPSGQPGQPQPGPQQWGPRPQQWPPAGPPQP